MERLTHIADLFFITGHNNAKINIGSGVFFSGLSSSVFFKMSWLFFGHHQYAILETIWAGYACYYVFLSSSMVGGQNWMSYTDTDLYVFGMSL